VIDWPVVIGGYLAIGVVALYLQHRYSIAALDRLAEAHERNVTDLKMMIEVLQLVIMQGQETKQGKMP